MKLLPVIMVGRKKPKSKPDNVEVEALINNALEPYMKREEVKDYIENIKKDEQKKRLWDSLSTRKKVKVLKYVLAKREGGKHEK